MSIDPSAIMSGLGAVIVSVGGYFFNRQDARISKLEENNVTRKEFDELRGDVRGLYGKMDENKDELISALLKDRG